MDGKYINKSAPKAPRCHSCVGRCNCFAELHDLAGCLTCTPFTAWHVMSGTLRRATWSSDLIASRAWQLRAKCLRETPRGVIPDATLCEHPACA